jgi:hypothetical protein
MKLHETPWNAPRCYKQSCLTRRAAVCAATKLGRHALLSQVQAKGSRAGHVPTAQTVAHSLNAQPLKWRATRGAHVVSPVLVLWKYVTPVRASAKRSQPAGSCVLLSMWWPSTSSAPSTTGSAAAPAALAAVVAGDVCDATLSPTGSLGLSRRWRSVLLCGRRGVSGERMCLSASESAAAEYLGAAHVDDGCSHGHGHQRDDSADDASSGRRLRPRRPTIVSSLSTPRSSLFTETAPPLTTVGPAVLPRASAVGAAVGAGEVEGKVEGEVEGRDEGEGVGKGEGEGDGDCTVIDPCARRHDACAVGWRP